MFAARVLSRNTPKIRGVDLNFTVLSSGYRLTPTGRGSRIRRHASTGSGTNGEEKEPRNSGSLGGPQPSGLWTFSSYFNALLVVGTGLTAYGLYGLYNVITMWPSDIRQDLRSGLRAKHKGDLEVAAQYLARAWEKSKILPLDRFGDEPLMKVTGIGIALGGVLEQDHKLEQAYIVYEDTFWLLRSAYLDLPPSTTNNRPDLGVETLDRLSGADKMRGVAISYKLGELSHILHKSPEEEEKWLVWSVEAILRIVLDAPPMAATEVSRRPGDLTAGGQGVNVKVLAGQLGLPAWTLHHDIAASFEALGTFYARTGNVSYALPLYLQAISILLPPPPNASPVEDKCKGAQIMGNMAELMVRNLDRKNVSTEATSQAEAWVKKGLDVVIAARKLSPVKHDVCEETLSMLLYNAAMIHELSGDTVRARALLDESLEQSRMIGMNKGIQYAQQALRDLDAGAEMIKPFSEVG